MLSVVIQVNSKQMDSTALIKFIFLAVIRKNQQRHLAQDKKRDEKTSSLLVLFELLMPAFFNWFQPFFSHCTKVINKVVIYLWIPL